MTLPKLSDEWADLRRRHGRLASMPRLLRRRLRQYWRHFVYRRWDLLVCERPAGAPMPAFPRHRIPEEFWMREATLEDAPLYDDPYWHFWRDRFKQRMAELPGYGVWLGVMGDRLVSNGPFHIGKFKDRALGYWFDPGEDGVYWHEGETVPEWRGAGIAIAGMRALFTLLEERDGVKRVMTYFRTNNKASARLHQRFGFAPTKLLVWRQLGPFRWTRELPVPEDLKWEVRKTKLKEKQPA